MFTPFIWMFKTEKFKKHFLYLFFTFFKFFIPAAIVYVLLIILSPDDSFDAFYSIAFYVAGILLPTICISGYFWELTSSIINRDETIKLASIYNGRVDVIETVTLPELKTLKFLWRGIASIVATTIMFIPFLMVIVFTGFVGGLSGMFCRMARFYFYGYLGVYILFLFLMPAFLWNYAKENSVVATIDLRKAIYIAGTYPWRYIWTIIRYVVIYVGCSYLFAQLALFLGIDTANIDFSVSSLLKLIVLCLVFYIGYIYSIFVYAYLLGSIAPRTEI